MATSFSARFPPAFWLQMQQSATDLLGRQPVNDDEVVRVMGRFARVQTSLEACFDDNPLWVECLRSLVDDQKAGVAAAATGVVPADPRRREAVSRLDDDDEEDDDDEDNDDDVPPGLSGVAGGLPAFAQDDPWPVKGNLTRAKFNQWRLEYAARHPEDLRAQNAAAMARRQNAKAQERKGKDAEKKKEKKRAKAHEKSLATFRRNQERGW